MAAADKIATIAKEIEAKFGEGSVVRLGKGVRPTGVEVVSSGSLLLDLALGVGGYPKGRIVEILGPESAGKSTLALHAVAEAQKAGMIAAYVDAEHAMDLTYAERLGVQVDDLLLAQPDSGEEGLDVALALVERGVGLVVVDSVAALVPRAEIEGEMGDAVVGVQARLMSKAMRKMTPVVAGAKAIVIFINQIRFKIGVLPHMNPETTSGGNALRFYASVRLDIRRATQIKDDGEVVGNLTRVKVIKNKVSPPFRTCEFDILYGVGINRLGELLDVAVERGIVQQKGSWYLMGEERLGQGREKAMEWLREHPEVVKTIDQGIRQN